MDEMEGRNNVVDQVDEEFEDDNLSFDTYYDDSDDDDDGSRYYFDPRAYRYKPSGQNSLEYYDDNVNLNAVWSVGHRFLDGHEHCSYLFQGAFLAPEEDMRWFWHPITQDDDTGYTDDESEDESSDEDEDDVDDEYSSSHGQSLEEELDIQEYCLEAEDFKVAQETFERGLYEDFRMAQNVVLKQDLLDFAARCVAMHRLNEERSTEVYSRLEKGWKEKVGNRKEWFDEAMAHRFDGVRP